jgi:1-acyl-sn-glycerol-3-phosphate acyltransferase
MMVYFKFALMFIWMILVLPFTFVLRLLGFGPLDTSWRISRVWAGGVLKLTGIRLHLKNEDQLEANQPCVYVANHQGAIDALTYGSVFPKNMLAIGKKEILWIPLFGQAYAAGGNILLDRQKSKKAIHSLGKAVQVIREKKASVIIFPEGTRNQTDDEFLPFKKGAFYMAIEAQVPIVPIVCAPVKGIINWKKREWNGGDLEMEVLPPFSTQGMKISDVDTLLEKTRNEMLIAYRRLAKEKTENQAPLKISKKRAKERLSLMPLILVFLGTGLGGCQSSLKSDHAFDSILVEPIRVRRPVGEGAVAMAFPGGIDYQSDPLPDERFDCRKTEWLFENSDLEAIRSCLNSLSEKGEAQYELRREAQPFLELQTQKSTPPCLSEALEKIPVPREIFFQELEEMREGQWLPRCYNSRVDLERGKLQGSEVPVGVWKMKVSLPLKESLEDEAATLRLVTAWALTPFFRPDENRRGFQAKFVPFEICQTCFEGETLDLKKAPLSPRWP